MVEIADLPLRGVAAPPVVPARAWRPWSSPRRESGPRRVPPHGAAALRRFARAVRVIPDAQAAALGALDGRPGVLVLSGTGSIVVGHDGRGRWARAGGFGPLLGDEGSGFWLGREWVRATTVPGDFEKIRKLAHAAQPVAAVAALAPAVLARARRGDAMAAPHRPRGPAVSRRLRRRPGAAPAPAASRGDELGGQRHGRCVVPGGRGARRRPRGPSRALDGAGIRTPRGRRAHGRRATGRLGPAALRHRRTGSHDEPRHRPARGDGSSSPCAPGSPERWCSRWSPGARGGGSTPGPSSASCRRSSPGENLDAVVRVREGCAGGCHGRGPNVSLTLHALPRPASAPTTSPSAGARTSARWPTLPSLQAILDENLALNAPPRVPVERRDDSPVGGSARAPCSRSRSLA